MEERKIYKNGIKPIFDIAFAVTLLFFLSPILILLVIVLTIHFQGKPFFIQKRVGKNHRIFLMLKFRSMTDCQNNKTLEIGKLTTIGMFIRKTSLDELPQLINVLRGEMSLVGPRPLLVDYLPFYNSEERKRHNVRPGITGLAQISGRNQIDWGERMKLDIFYSHHTSFLLDSKILIKTCFEIFRFRNSTFKDNQMVTFAEYASRR